MTDIKPYKGFLLREKFDCGYQPQAVFRKKGLIAEIFNFETDTVVYFITSGDGEGINAVPYPSLSRKGQHFFDEVREHFFPDTAAPKIKNTPC